MSNVNASGSCSSPPPASISSSISSPTMAATTTTTTMVTSTPAQSVSAQASSATSSSAASSQPHQHQLPHHPPPSSSRAPLQTTLPSADTQRQVAEARAAVVASMSNMVDTELQTRAGILHDNAAALARQEKDVEAATAGLRREREKLQREADGAARRLKELGNVQNWAEVLERQFLVLEETVRLANGGGSGSNSERGSSCSCSCSDCDDRAMTENGDVVGPPVGDDHGDGTEDYRLDQDHFSDDDGFIRKDNDETDDSKIVEGAEDSHMVDMMHIDRAPTAWSDTSRSFNEPESSTGTGMAKSSETASTSTNNE